MKLVHYSANPKLELRPIPKSKWGGRHNFGSQRVADKPHGLWLSDDDKEPNWRSWCESERFNLDRLMHCYEVQLSPNANILILSGSRAIRKFHEQNCDQPFSLNHLSWIDWGPTVDNYQGIVITPYVWRLRLEQNFLWYYSWDCASGCIWDIEAIASFKEIRP